MLRRLMLRDVVLVTELTLEFGPGFTVLTGETGAGKSILIDALQLALGQRAEAGLVREGAARCEVSAEFDTPAALQPWLAEQGFDAPAEDASSLLLRRQVDARGKSRGWINGSPATAAQLRSAAEALVDIHGQHAWQSLTRAAAVRALLDAQAGSDVPALTAAWQAWRGALAALEAARSAQADLARERERLQWQLGEMDTLNPGADEWAQLNEEHQRLSHGAALLEGAREALNALSEGGAEPEPGADALLSRAAEALAPLLRFDPKLQGVHEAVLGAQSQLRDAAHELQDYLGRSEPDPHRLAELDARLSAWMALARRYRRSAAELPALRQQWREEFARLEAATDVQALEQAAQAREASYRAAAQAVSQARAKAAPRLARSITAAMQGLGMPGGRFEVALVKAEAPQAHGLEEVEFRVAGHAGSTPRPLAKVASGGELSRLALAIAVSTANAASRSAAVPTLIFDEVDAGIGGSVADAVGRLMQSLGRHTQVLAVTHLAQVAACADGHFVVAKARAGAATRSQVQAVAGTARVAEIARMLGGEHLSDTSRAHAQAMINAATHA